MILPRCAGHISGFLPLSVAFPDSVCDGIRKGLRFLSGLCLYANPDHRLGAGWTNKKGALSLQMALRLVKKREDVRIPHHTVLVRNADGILNLRIEVERRCKLGELFFFASITCITFREVRTPSPVVEYLLKIMCPVCSPPMR